MAKISYDNLEAVEALTANNNDSGSDVGFFSLKNDNDEAVVRFICDSVDDFEILTIHDVPVGSKYRKVNCIRDPREPIENCPLCSAGMRISNRIYIKMIQYNKVTDEQGIARIVPKAVVWDRHISYAKTLKSYLENYGPLSDIICKIIRHGKANDMQTTYEIVPNLNKAVFPDEVYVKDTTLFGTYSAFGTIVMNKSREDMNHYLATNEFPVQPSTAQPQPSNNIQPINSQITPRTYVTSDTPAAPVTPQMPEQPIAQPTYQPPVVPPVSTAGAPSTYSAPVVTPAAPVVTPPSPVAAPAWGGNTAGDAGVLRPRRY